MTNLYNAHHQWAIRLPDERFPTLEELYAFTKARKERSSEEVRNLEHVELKVTPDCAIAMNGETPQAMFTNWAFSQLCSALRAPAGYLRRLSPDLVRDCLAHSMKVTHEQCKIMLRSTPTGDGVHEECWATAFTSPSYGRIWDADVVESLMASVEGSGWHVPPAHPNHGSENAGLYASDRDMFAFLVNDESPVEIGNARLGRGFFIWNSETGASTFGLTTFLYNYTCGNHVVWGAEQVNELRIIHRNKALDRFYADAIPALNRFVESRSLTDSVRSVVGRAMDTKVGSSLEEVLTWFAPKPFSKRELIAGLEAGKAEGDDTGTVWGMVQGITAYARNLRHTNERVDLERRAGALLG